MISLGLCLPSALSAKEPGKPLRVVCTILPIYSLTLNVVNGISGVQVELLLSPQQGCPHNYDLTPGDLIKLSRADLIIANGLGMEEFLAKALKQGNLKARVIQAAEKVEPIGNKPASRHLHHSKNHTDIDHNHDGSVNGHAWVSPTAAAIMVRTIAEGLALQDPIHAREYRFNAKQYSKKLEGLAREMEEWVSQAKNKKCLTFHDVLAYLARDIGLSIIGVIESHPGIEPSPKDMIRLIDMLKSQKVAAIFSEPQYSDKIARTLSRESGVPLFELDPAATGKPEADTYEKAMRKNLEILRNAVK
ncbi:MAG: metal ABC transporter substrate-binding protein [Deltaproteobacteria bacterium]|nr:metal ABC transporter substrate-binding protein [Deltaproteobacteria bacterium]